MGTKMMAAQAMATSTAIIEPKVTSHSTSVSVCPSGQNNRSPVQRYMLTSRAPAQVVLTSQDSQVPTDDTACTTAPQGPLIPNIQAYHHSQGILYVSAFDELKGSIRIKWEEELLPRLDQELGTLNLAYSSRDIYAAGRKPSALKPTVVILCTSEKAYRKVRKQLKPTRFLSQGPPSYQKILEQCEIGLEILIDPGFGKKGSSIEGLDGVDSRGLPGGAVDIEIMSFNFLRGASIRLRDHDSALATIGCVIEVDNRFYGLTVGHPFSDWLKERARDSIFGASIGDAPLSVVDDSSSESDGDISVWSESEEVLPDSGDIASELDSSQGLFPPQGGERLMPGLTNSPHQVRGTIIALGWSSNLYATEPIVPPTWCKADGSNLQPSDWAIIELEASTIASYLDAIHDTILLRKTSKSPSENSYNIAFGSPEKQRQTVEANRIDAKPSVNSNNGSQGQRVEIGFRDLPQMGVLNRSFSHITLDGSTYRVHQVTLSRKLELGDSGSWVTDADSHKMLGMVIAGGGFFPWAYMIPIRELLLDISAKLGVEVSVPGEKQLWSMRLRQHALGAPEPLRSQPLNFAPSSSEDYRGVKVDLSPEHLRRKLVRRKSKNSQASSDLEGSQIVEGITQEALPPLAADDYVSMRRGLDSPSERLTLPDYQNPPCNTFCVGNLPDDPFEDELKAFFSQQKGYKRMSFRTNGLGPMCYVEFEDTNSAAKALDKLDGHPLLNSVTGGIRLRFSKHPLNVQSMNPPTPPPQYLKKHILVAVWSSNGMDTEMKSVSVSVEVDDNDNVDNEAR